MCIPDTCYNLLRSSSDALYSKLIEWRDTDPDGPVSFEKKWGTELGLPFIALLGLIEGIVKSVFIVFTIPLALAFGNGIQHNDKVNWADTAFVFTGGGAVYSFEASIRSLIALVYNLIDDEYLTETGDTTQDIFERYLTCLN